MTNNQIQYWKLQHEKSTLAENVRHNLATEDQARLELRETGRHNVAGEQQAINVLHETQRHNKQVENTDISRLAETKRHDISTEAIQQFKNQIDRFYQRAQVNARLGELSEQQRTNRVKETETERHNRAVEVLDEFKNVVQSTYNQAIIDARAEERELEADKLAFDKDKWLEEYNLNRDKWLTSLEQWQREKLTQTVEWGVGELSDIFQSFLRFNRNNNTNYNQGGNLNEQTRQKQSEVPQLPSEYPSSGGRELSKGQSR
nr:putative ORF1 [Marmot picobirnavirus]